MVEGVHGICEYRLTRGIERPLDSKQERALKSPFVIIIIMTEFLRAHRVDGGVLQRRAACDYTVALLRASRKTADVLLYCQPKVATVTTREIYLEGT